MFPFPIYAPDAGAALTYIASTQDTSNASAYTFAGQSFGAAQSDRYIIVGVSTGGTGGSAKTLNDATCTIGGVTPTKVVEVAGANGVGATILIAAVPTGTTGTIYIDTDDSQTNVTIHVYRAVGLASATAHATASDLSGDPSSVNVNVPSGGFAIAVNNIDSSSGTTTWTGVTEDYDAVVESNNIASCASASFSSAQTPLAVTSDHSGSTTAHALVVASWS